MAKKRKTKAVKPIEAETPIETAAEPLPPVVVSKNAIIRATKLSVGDGKNKRRLRLLGIKE